MLSIQTLQQSGQMSSHMTNQSGNQDLIFLITLILGLIVIALIGLIILFFYFFYTGRLHFSNQKYESRIDKETQNETERVVESNGIKITSSIDLPPVNLNPLEKKILEVIITGHNVLQSDVPNLVQSSKSKVSEALTHLEEERLIQRVKAGRSLTIKYIYEPTK